MKNVKERESKNQKKHTKRNGESKRRRVGKKIVPKHYGCSDNLHCMHFGILYGDEEDNKRDQANWIKCHV